MKRIKIAVACHKPSELPKNDLFVPIQVGAALAKNRLDGVEYDNSGDNISEKNPAYCELTAQYWLWKNVEADYYGLCHYRRFLCFKDTGSERDLRNQITASVLNENNMHRFGLDDEKKMRSIIEENDAVIGEEQYVPYLYTPHGNQKTAYEHWVAHDRALIMKKDLDLMLKILTEVSPKIGKAAREYLGTKNFLGFNCFILKKELFDELCEIEFEVLKRLEKQVDTSTYCQQLSRIYGFMGEIISSSYFYYLSQSHKYKIKRVPLVYFSYTEPVDLMPVQKKKVIPVIFNAADLRPEYFAIEWKSFVENVEKDYFYDAVAVIDGNCKFKKEFMNEIQNKENISLRFVDANAYRGYYNELYGLWNDNGGSNKEDISDHFSLLPFLPFIFKEYGKAIVVGENNIFCESIASLWEQSGDMEGAICAPKDVLMISLINDIYVETAELRFKRYIKDYLKIFSTNIMVWDFAKSREMMSEKNVAAEYKNLDKTIKRKLIDKNELMNRIYEGNFEFVGQEYNVLYDSNEFLIKQLPYMPLLDYQELMKARSNPVVVSYMPNDPWEDVVYNEATVLFWQFAYKTNFQEVYRRRGVELAIYRSAHDGRSVISRLFPVDGVARGKMTRILPPGSKRNAAIKIMLSKMGLR